MNKKYESEKRCEMGSAKLSELVDKIKVDVTYTCSDGETFTSMEEAQAHEQIMCSPEYKYQKLEDRIKALESEIASLKNKMDVLEIRVKASNPFVLGNDYQERNKKLPAAPGSVVFGSAPSVGNFTVMNGNKDENK